MRWKKALRREVVDTSTAETVGRVEGFVVDPTRAQLTAVVVGPKVVAWSDAGGVGRDAVTIEKSGMLSDPSSDAESAAVEGEVDPIAKTVFTEDGFDIGTVVDIVVDSTSGAIERLVLADDEIAGSRLLGAGSFAVVVSSSSSPRASGDLGSLTKAELYERAKERDLEGRSSMTKKELIAALS